MDEMGITLPDKVYIFLFVFSFRISKIISKVMIESKIIHYNLNFYSVSFLYIAAYIQIFLIFLL